MIFVILVAIGIILIVASGSFLIQTKKDAYEKALALAALGNYVDARVIIRDILDNSPSNVRAHYVIAKIYAMEGDTVNEARHLEKIKKIGTYEKGINEVSVSNRIADIYYQQDLFEEALFHYLDTVAIDPQNPEANVRIGFMALGQKEFMIADRFLGKISDEKIKIASIFIGKGVISAILRKGNPVEFFAKAYDLEPSSPVGGFLYALSLTRDGKYDEAVRVANSVADLVEDDYVRYTIFQFLMCCFILQKNLGEALKHARLCMEMARNSGWKQEMIDSDVYFSLLAVKLGKLEEASEYLIEAESERIDDQRILELANYKFQLETKRIEANKATTASGGFSLDDEIARIFGELFPVERFYELSGLKSSKSFHIKGILDDQGNKLLSDVSKIGIGVLDHYRQLKGVEFKNLCVRIVVALNYTVSREVPNKEGDGVNLTGLNKADKETRSLFKFRKWKDAKISDIFLRDTIGQLNELGLDKAVIVGDAEFTEGAKRFLADNSSLLDVISGKDLEEILKKALHQETK
ncbi:tetratricopeptide repeat protein [Leptospira santarosai]|uniref:Restriction endonuclease n=1 Tax=Leptospira santarosai str. MOR084 TaxID=1049984 RepID=A0A0E2BH28_9LEPT|nr:tetratricopeptide repeat protein [Leptospira santarosai]EKO34241.1 restriction endonuclease [Leptospira santarosai str. MOR084]EMJ46761.1 restriction endonuclease [Leptospira santarosai str. HAI1349]EMO24452.1 restriction endonuclease [Leptospira santarosai str. HAI134]EMO32772.1 restriction endonuclease [Leptospira santarosai str. HAI821]MDI7156297.1 tetratricopeptide repeat protein [Leptospira santarosai]